MKLYAPGLFLILACFSSCEAAKSKQQSHALRRSSASSVLGLDELLTLGNAEVAEIAQDMTSFGTSASATAVEEDSRFRAGSSTARLEDALTALGQTGETPALKTMTTQMINLLESSMKQALLNQLAVLQTEINHTQSAVHFHNCTHRLDEGLALAKKQQDEMMKMKTNLSRCINKWGQCLVIPNHGSIAIQSPSFPDPTQIEQRVQTANTRGMTAALEAPTGASFFDRAILGGMAAGDYYELQQEHNLYEHGSKVYTSSFNDAEIAQIIGNVTSQVGQYYGMSEAEIENASAETVRRYHQNINDGKDCAASAGAASLISHYYGESGAMQASSAGAAAAAFAEDAGWSLEEQVAVASSAARAAAFAASMTPGEQTYQAGLAAAQVVSNRPDGAEPGAYLYVDDAKNWQANDTNVDGLVRSLDPRVDRMRENVYTLIRATILSSLHMSKAAAEAAQERLLHMPAGSTLKELSHAAAQAASEKESQWMSKVVAFAQAAYQVLVGNWVSPHAPASALLMASSSPSTSSSSSASPSPSTSSFSASPSSSTPSVKSRVSGFLDLFLSSVSPGAFSLDVGKSPSQSASSYVTSPGAFSLDYGTSPSPPAPSHSLSLALTGAKQGTQQEIVDEAIAMVNAAIADGVNCSQARKHATTHAAKKARVIGIQLTLAARGEISGACTADPTPDECDEALVDCSFATEECQRWEEFDDRSKINLPIDPDANICNNDVADQLEPYLSYTHPNGFQYEPRQDYFKQMRDYWGTMIEKWYSLSTGCPNACRECQRTLMICPNSTQVYPSNCPNTTSTTTTTEAPMPTPMPMPTPTPTPMPTPMHKPFSGLPCENCSCRTCQDRLDEAACWQARRVSESCEDYDKCYADKNETAYQSWKNACNSQLEQLRWQWYGVMRVECLVYALKESDYERADAINKCKNKKREDYDFAIISSIWLPECKAFTPPPYVAATGTYCVAAMDPYSSINMSGGEMYEEYWYTGFSHGNCVADCCFPALREQVVPAYHPPASTYA